MIDWNSTYGARSCPWTRARFSPELDTHAYYYYNPELIMHQRDLLGEFEQIVLLAVLRLEQNAYGVPIRNEIEGRTKRSVTIGALYSTLDRLEEKGFLSSVFSDPRPERGGRSRRYFRVEPHGIKALQRTRDALSVMWDGVNLRKA